VSSELPATEAANAESAGLDLLETPALVALLVAEHRHAVDAVLTQAGAIARAVDAIVARLSRGGSLHYVGAGSSGRIATLDAAEMPPTFGTPPDLVQAHIAGGIAALQRAVEGAEDDGAAGDRAMGESVGDSDAVVGISASGGAAFVIAAIERARRSGSYTLGMTNVENSPLARVAEDTIVLATGPEALAGSTRLKAATAQKIALNAISTAVMVRLGKVHDNLMIDLIASNAKLRRRALRLVTLLADIGEERAREMLDAAEGNVRVAVVMARRNLDVAQARALLDRHAGSLRAVL
jgi:N-acetylmuramic acid 6-phosphate etherase